MSAKMTWNWKEQREKAAFLALADGTVLRGHSVGAPVDALGEVVFNTGMTGYEEILSDPSYCGQIVTMTYPEIGSYGINAADMESRGLFASGLIIHEMNATSNWRADESLREFLTRWNVPAIAGIDTRALTMLLREKGTQRGYMSVGAGPAVEPDLAKDPLDRQRSGGSERVKEDAAAKIARGWCGLDGQDYAARVSCVVPYRWDADGKLTCTWGVAESLPKPDMKIVAFDFGIKWNILRGMRRSGMDVTVVPAKTSAKDVLALKPDGVFFSNGPADPAAVTYAVQAAKDLLGKVPVMGICLGHQILGLASGGRTYRLKFGHHGCNHPVKDLVTGKVEITSQNHNFAVDIASLDSSRVEVTHMNLNDNTVEGLQIRKDRMFCVQYHPEAAPGPHDPFYLFGRFRDMITGK
jgi:carbamoyl-phosphate synthase small subunit